jgi:hypothetical protein
VGVLKLILLHLVCAGFLIAGLAAKGDLFFAQWCFALAVGAFALAWTQPGGGPGSG